MPIENLEKQPEKKEYDALCQKTKIIAQKIAELAKIENYTGEEVSGIAGELKNLFTEAEKLARKDINYYGEDIKHGLYMNIDSILKNEKLKGKTDANTARSFLMAIRDEEYGPYNQRIADIWDKIDDILKKEGVDLMKIPEK